MVQLRLHFSDMRDSRDMFKGLLWWSSSSRSSRAGEECTLWSLSRSGSRLLSMATPSLWILLLLLLRRLWRLNWLRKWGGRKDIARELKAVVLIWGEFETFRYLFRNSSIMSGFSLWQDQKIWMRTCWRWRKLGHCWKWELLERQSKQCKVGN